jgi:hypothetical protein
MCFAENSDSHRLCTNLHLIFNTVFPAKNREFAYSLRIRILETIDHTAAPSTASGSTSSSTSGSSSNVGDLDSQRLPETGRSSMDIRGGAGSCSGGLAECGHCVDDLARFFLSVGLPYAQSRNNYREQILRKQQQQQQQQQRLSPKNAAGGAPSTPKAPYSGSKASTAKAKRRNRRRDRSGGGGGENAVTVGDDDFHGAGAIL